MLTQVLDTPWKARNELERWLAYPYTRLLFRLNGIDWGQDWRFYGAPILQKHRASTMNFGSSLYIRSSMRSNPSGITHPTIFSTLRRGAVLSVGDHFGMSGGSICAAEAVTIGDHVTVGANTLILDTDFHPLDPVERRRSPRRAKTAPVIIEDDVFIGAHCLILKGVTIGRAGVVGAGSVVRRDVPPGSLVIGNPARLVERVAESTIY